MSRKHWPVGKLPNLCGPFLVVVAVVVVVMVTFIVVIIVKQRKLTGTSLRFCSSEARSLLWEFGNITPRPIELDSPPRRQGKPNVIPCLRKSVKAHSNFLTSWIRCVLRKGGHWKERHWKIWDLLGPPWWHSLIVSLDVRSSDGLVSLQLSKVLSIPFTLLWSKLWSVRLITDVSLTWFRYA